MTSSLERFIDEPSETPVLREEERGSTFGFEELVAGYGGNGYSVGTSEDGKTVFQIEENLVRHFKQMLDTDGKAQSIENLLVFPIIAAPKDIVASKGDTGEAEKIREILFSASYEGGMRTPFEVIILQMAKAMTYKKTFFERIPCYRESDGLYGYEAIAWRPQETCELALDARTARYKGFRQQVIDYSGSKKPMTPNGYQNFNLDTAFVYIYGSWADPIEGISAMQVPYWALAHGSKVQTPYGEVNIEDVNVGDEVYGSNGSPTRVLEVHPQGVRKMYRIHFKDGRSVDCDGQHLWGIYNRNGSYEVKSTKQMLDAGVRLKGSNPKPRFSVPSTGSVEYGHKFVPVDPYILGAWLGDGSIGKDRHGVGRYAVRIASAERFIPEEVERRLPSDLKLVRCAGDYLFRPVIARSSNPLRDALVSMGVNVDAYDKFIPDLYMEGSVKQRWDLLRGLMDTDGSYGHGTGKPSNSSRFHTVSKKLAEGVQRLVHSLGGSAIIRWKQGRNIYTVELLTNESPFLMPRKDAMWKPSDRRANIAITDIEEIGDSECRCITVENEDGLFLTNDYVVTHNCYQTKRRLMWLWYGYLDTTSLPKMVVKGDDVSESTKEARRLATLKARGTIGWDKRFEIEALESSGKGAEQFEAAIRFLDSEMSNSVLAGFMDLTSSAAAGKGSFALSEDQSKLFLRSRRVVAWDMSRQFNEQVIAPLVRWNFGKKASYPKLVFGPLSEASETTVVDLFSKILAQAPTGAAVPDEFYDQVIERVAQIVELDTDKVHAAIAKDGGQLKKLKSMTDAALGAVQAQQGQQNGTGKVSPAQFLEEAGKKNGN